MPQHESTLPRGTRPEITLVTRPWDHLSPIATGELAPSGFSLRLLCEDRTPDPWTEPDLDGGEASFSRYVRAQASGDDSVLGLPVFLMRSFRHRCFLVRRDSALTDPAELANASIGLTGWPDSGNTWTRSLLRRAGVDLAGIKWTVGPMTADSPHRAQPTLPPNVRVAEPDQTLVTGLLDGEFDAIMAPFMPPGFYSGHSGLRHLLPDYRAGEVAYFRDVGFVPGIHLTVLRRDLVESYPWLPSAVTRLLEESKQLWHQRRRAYADTTPWILEEFSHTDHVIGGDWMPYGVDENAAMVEAFCAELSEQDITSDPVDTSAVFADYRDLAAAYPEEKACAYQ